jgi:hypothetical protein
MRSTISFRCLSAVELFLSGRTFSGGRDDATRNGSVPATPAAA